MSTDIHPSSFRDPSGFLFTRNGILYRQVNQRYRNQYDHGVISGLYQRLIDANALIPHQEVEADPALPELAYKVIQPERIQYISYPYEWCFSQIKDAALLTLSVQQTALEHGMTLKDASAYNVQFHHGKPVFIDTLSFDMYEEGSPWQAYRQFCQHFLAPLALMSRCDVRLNSLMRNNLDGIPLDLASVLLHKRTGLNFGLLSHIHMHAKAQKHYENAVINARKARMSRFAFLALLDSLASTIKNLTWTPKGTEWGEYYDHTNYTDAAAEHKHILLDQYMNLANPATVWDLGANTGVYSRTAAKHGCATVAFDIDPAAVEKHYRDCKTRGETCILPLMLDLTNPSPAIGWAHEERSSFIQRGPVDMILALALIHHLAISNNMPIDKIASFLAELCDTLIIEFVPKNDTQVQRLLTTREDIFPHYTREQFERNMQTRFTIQESAPIRDTERTLYLMRRKAIG